MRTDEATIEEAFKAHEGFLWGICYRLTGSAADADDLVQETFVRAMERPPARTEDPWRPWLVRVAMNLGRDWLRRRRRRAYVGPWLPSPVETDDAFFSSLRGPSTETERGPEAHYEAMESFPFAFLLALEALTPRQRAILLFRDVLDHSVRETAETLGLSEASVKTAHHRARRAMRDYDGERRLPARSLRMRARGALERLVDCVRRQDVAGVEALLADGVRTMSDGGGEFHAGRIPVVGRKKVARYYLRVSGRKGFGDRVAIRTLNGLPAIVSEFTHVPNRWAPRSVLRCDLDREGRIRELHIILASRKLLGVRFGAAGRLRRRSFPRPVPMG